MISRLGLVGDVHQEDAYLERALDALKDVDAIFCTGDLADGKGDLARCCALLAEREVIVISGNHDRWLLGDTMRQLDGAIALADVSLSLREWLAALPSSVRVATVRGEVLLCHGAGDDDMSVVSEDTAGYDLENNSALKALIASELFGVVGGHKHRTFARTFEREGREPLRWVNPGTLKRHLAPPPGRAPGYCVWHLEEDRVDWWALDDHYPAELTLEFTKSERTSTTTSSGV